jgi:hypothetical protein
MDAIENGTDVRSDDRLATILTKITHSLKFNIE